MFVSRGEASLATLYNWGQRCGRLVLARSHDVIELALGRGISASNLDRRARLSVSMLRFLVFHAFVDHESANGDQEDATEHESGDGGRVGIIILIQVLRDTFSERCFRLHGKRCCKVFSISIFSRF